MTGKNSSTRETSDREFLISRLIDAPRSLVFQAWVDPQHMTKWWGPGGFTNPVCEMDVRPGGAYRWTMRSPDGIDYPIKGFFLEIVEPERLVMTMDLSEHPAAWQDMIKPDRGPNETNPSGELIQSVTLEEVGGKTRLTIRTRFESVAIRDQFLKIGMTEGWSQSLDRLEEALTGMPSAGTGTTADTAESTSQDGSILLKVKRHIEAPAEQVFDAWLDPQSLGHWLFATPGGEMLRVEVDPRVGGEFVVVEQRGELRAEHFGQYVTIDRPQQLAFTFTTDRAEPPSLVTIEIRPLSDGCEVVLTHKISPKWASYADKVRSGWIKILEGLSNTILADRLMVTTRLFDAPRELVFDAWTIPHHVAQWWGPNGFANTIYEMDVRPGGVWRFVMHGPDGVDYQNKNVFLEVVKPERLVFLHVSGPLFRMTVNFDEIGGKTKVTMRMLFETAALRIKVAEQFGAVEGAKQTLARLDQFLTANRTQH